MSTSSDESLETVSWSAYHSTSSPTVPENGTDKTAMLPIFQDEAKSVAMIKHSMDIIRAAIHHLNPGQTPVMACDQPLYALAKQIQWNWPQLYGENKFVIMFGGLHIEMAAWKTIGDWLENCGWTAAVTRSNLATSGVADSFLKCSHVSRTRHAHEVTVCSLYILQQRSYNEYLDSFIGSDSGDSILNFKDWIDKRTNECPLFQFWSITLTFELSILILVRSIREGNFKLYILALKQLLPWFFALDHINYSRWLSIHLRDLTGLQETNPDVNEEFAAGKCVIHKTRRSFSGISIDHAHEQNNRSVKDDGGAIGLTENSSQLLRWMVSGPELARITSEFELSQDCLKFEKTTPTNHHQDSKSNQKRFESQVKSLVNTIEEMGNPFSETSEDLVQLDTKDMTDSSVIETVRGIEKFGNDQYHAFVEDRLVKRVVSLSEPIKKNKLHLFSYQKTKSVKPSATKQTITSLKKSCSLFSQLYVSCQIRDGDLDDFFRHENQSFPPALSSFGDLRSGNKADLLTCLEDLSSSTTSTESPSVDAVLLDGAAIVNMLKPGHATTFSEYAEQVFQPYVKGYLQKAKRVDIVWDVYLEDSLKATARHRRGLGVRRRVLPDTKLPVNWQSFLRTDSNKTELFQYLAKEAVAIDPCYGQVVSTYNKEVVSNTQEYEASLITPCNHEEADTRLILHAYDCSAKNMTKLMIRTVDTDVVVLATAFYNRLSVQELWIAFGVGKKYRFIAIHEIVLKLGDAKSESLAGFHAFTGCDNTSFFCGRGKKTAFDTCRTFEDSINAFQQISTCLQQEAIGEIQPVLERYVVILFDRTCELESVDKARKLLFTQKGRQIDHIPPTSAALLQHSKRAVFQAGYIWGQSLIPEQEIPPPSDWGWIRNIDQMWLPLWTTIPEAAKSCTELIRCACKTDHGCRGRCKCIKANLKCTALCKCGGDCN